MCPMEPAKLTHSTPNVSCTNDRADDYTQLIAKGINPMRVLATHQKRIFDDTKIN